MAWVWPKDVDAVKRSLYGRYGPDFDEGVDRLIEMITRYEGKVGRQYRAAIANRRVAQCAKTLVALSSNVEFNIGVISMVAALLPQHYLSEFPGDVAEIQAKLIAQKERRRCLSEGGP